MSTIHVFRSNSSSILNTRTLKLLLKVYTIIVYSSPRCERKLRPKKKKYCYDAPFFDVHVVVTRSWEVHVLGYYLNVINDHDACDLNSFEEVHVSRVLTTSWIAVGIHLCIGRINIKFHIYYGLREMFSRLPLDRKTN